VVELTAEQQRILGCLIEKEAFTPDGYPLTLNALVLACNQSSNRDPAVDYDDADVTPALDQLRDLGLVRVVHSPSHRATKYRHVAGEAWALTSGELAVLAVLLLRGPQTVNELRTRTERYGSDIEDLGGVEAVLGRLATAKEEPFVRRLDRQAGQREERWIHLLSPDRAGFGSERSLHSMTLRTESPRSVTAEVAQNTADAVSLEGLARQIATLRDEFDELQRQVGELQRRAAEGGKTDPSDAF
jgi:uncharacterized protein YceH (UPF0502 family)